MKAPPRVLMITPIPPRRGGIAAWAGILRSGTERWNLEFEDPTSWRSEEFRGLPAKALAGIRLLGRLARRLTLRRPELVHLNCCLSPLGVWRDLLLAALVSARRLPLVVHYRGSVPDCLQRLPAPSRFALRRLIRLASLNLGVTVSSARLLARLCPASPSAYLPNFVEDEWFDMARSAPEKAARQPRAVYVGRLSRDKGTLELFEVARRLPHVEFRLVGEIFDEVAATLGASPTNLTVTGHLPRPQVMRELLAGDIFVFPSHREGFPIAVLEAMAAALPVVSTQVGAIPDIIQEGRGGYLVSPGDVPALAEAIGWLAQDRELARRMGDENRRACRERFKFSAVFPYLSSAYERLSPSTMQREAAAALPGLPPEAPDALALKAGEART